MGSKGHEDRTIDLDDGLREQVGVGDGLFIGASGAPRQERSSPRQRLSMYSNSAAFTALGSSSSNPANK
jgi:hypothetical protein